MKAATHWQRVGALPVPAAPQKTDTSTLLSDILLHCSAPAGPCQSGEGFVVSPPIREERGSNTSKGSRTNAPIS
jgi:hypothetical protein